MGTAGKATGRKATAKSAMGTKEAAKKTGEGLSARWFVRI
jgi:hypothetical protein